MHPGEYILQAQLTGGIAIPGESETIAQGLRLLNSSTLVVASAQCSPLPKESERQLFYAELDGKLTLLLDVWVPSHMLTTILNTLPEGITVLRGSTDAMVLDRATYVWAGKGHHLYLWKHGLLVGEFDPAACRIRSGFPLRWSYIPNMTLSSSHGFLSKNWLRRGVQLHRQDGSFVPIARKTDLVLMVNPAYGKYDLQRDTRWVSDLSRSIAHAAGISVVLDEPLA